MIELLRVSFPAACGANLHSRPKDAVMRSGQYPAPWGREVYYLTHVAGTRFYKSGNGNSS